MDEEVIGATAEFRKWIIAVLLYTDWLLRYGAIIKPEYFPSDAERELVGWINGYYQGYHDAPMEQEIRNGLDGADVLDLLEEVEACSDEDLQYAADVAMDFTQAQAMKLAILESVDSIQEGDLQKPLELVRDAQRIGRDRLNLGLDLLEDAETWVYEEQHGKRFPTGIPDIDRILGGGVVGGEYGLVMAPPGRGKSTMLINIGFGMAGLVGAANVLNVTYEMPVQKYLKRYAKRVAGIGLHRGMGSEETYIRSLRKKASQRLKGKLRVVRPADNTVEGIQRLIDNLAAESFITEALIVDYPDLMRPLRKRKELRFELADITRDLRDMGHDYGIPIWGATQAGRQAIYKEYITIADIAEAIEKAAIADLVVSVCQTREEENLGHGRLFLAKVRDAEDRFVVPVNLDFENQSITARRAILL